MIDPTVAARVMSVDIVVDPGRAIRVCVTAHQQLHHDGAETEDQSREVQHSHAARVAQRDDKDRWKHKTSCAPAGLC